MKKWMVFVWSTLVCMACSAQEKADYTPEDRAIFDTYVQAMQGKEHLPLGDLLAPSVEPSKAAFANLLKYAKTNVLNLPKRQTRANLTRSERSETDVKFSFKFNRKALK